MSFGSFTPPPPLIFARKYYDIWIMKMKTYFLEYDLWEVVDSDRESPPLQHSDEAAKKYKALSCL
ncbi:receptor-like protein kinase FERONIA [Gossypium australe]|uniref:Receptor-like protein kinase FERONIA n=1 Tax=Gossypium australe TaxID=47621 RepID=A0A5B6WZL0_9ROSI|nr:receptor-like protein kinase FERONIA [Gossypium australe]